MPTQHPDIAALARLGGSVRQRLDADPSAFKVPTDQIELYGVANFLSEAECDRLIAIIDAVAQPSELFTTPYSKGHRTSYSGNVDSSDPFVRMIERRIDDLLGIPHEFGETVQGQRYQVGQEFRAHNDYFHTGEAYWPEQSRRGGQRSWTAMAYLNAVEEGGSTLFNKIGLDIPPQPGTLIVWNNMLPNGAPNPDTIHAGTPVVRGTKYIVTKWYRTRKWG
ncbi:prolyl hydroxylase family protein [Novosphingobium tardum]|uniref:Prolyl hydroxylase family protein n=1 Tax=Novosphingobium tardum TaxID=1538021 RepID=A0ABV8RS38_9SPHN